LGGGTYLEIFTSKDLMYYTSHSFDVQIITNTGFPPVVTYDSHFGFIVVATDVLDPTGVHTFTSPDGLTWTESKCGIDVDLNYAATQSNLTAMSIASNSKETVLICQLVFANSNLTSFVAAENSEGKLVWTPYSTPIG
jgi:hypothetical protein